MTRSSYITNYFWKAVQSPRTTSPFAVGRINWLFFASPAGARTSALFFSLIETAKANNIEPDAYFRFLFVEVPKVTSDADLRTLLPQ